MSTSSDFYDTALAGVRDLAATREDLKPLLEYYEGILAAQKDTYALFVEQAGAPDAEQCRNKNSEGKPCLTPDDIHLDWPAFDALFDHIGSMAAKHEEATAAEGLGSWPSVADLAGEWRDALLRGVLQEDASALDSCVAGTEVDPAVFIFLAYQALTPFLEAGAARCRGNVDETNWLKGRCPVCGGEPLMGTLEKETGKRILECHACRSSWPFKRMQCPFCETEEQDKLRYFLDAEDPAHRVDVCDACKTYLKTVDLREADRDVCLLVENLATVHLDLVAKEEGFCRDTNKLLGL